MPAFGAGGGGGGGGAAPRIESDNRSGIVQRIQGIPVTSCISASLSARRQTTQSSTDSTCEVWAPPVSIPMRQPLVEVRRFELPVLVWAKNRPLHATAPFESCRSRPP